MGQKHVGKNKKNGTNGKLKNGKLKILENGKLKNGKMWKNGKLETFGKMENQICHRRNNRLFRGKKVLFYID